MPDEIDYNKPSLKVKAMGIEIDSLTDKQKEYMANWQDEHKLPSNFIFNNSSLFQ